MPSTTLYSVDMGEHTLFAIHHLEIRDPRGFALMMGLGSMGSGIGAAIGMKIARPERAVVSVCGDGGFSMCLGDIVTAARERIPIVVAVMNDERYGMVELGDTVIYGRTPHYPTGPMNIPDLARAVGAQGIAIESPGQLLQLDLPRLLQGGPVILDIRIDRALNMSRARLEFLKKHAHGARAKSSAPEKLVS
jgi:acetolactate synthase-1/2/3 large subunit